MDGLHRSGTVSLNTEHLSSTMQFNKLLQLLAKSGDAAGIEKVLAKMDAAQLQRDVFTYNAGMMLDNGDAYPVLTCHIQR